LIEQFLGVDLRIGKRDLAGVAECGAPRFLPDPVLSDVVFLPAACRAARRLRGADLEVIGEVSESILNHSKKDMDKVYNNANYLKQKLAALTKWEGLPTDARAWLDGNG
jgi:hypothetical protein